MSENSSGLTGGSGDPTLTPMSMTKTQLYFPDDELRALHRLSKESGRPVAELVREAVRRTWLTPSTGEGARGPVALWTGPFAGASADHESAFDEP